MTTDKEYSLLEGVGEKNKKNILSRISSCMQDLSLFAATYVVLTALAIVLYIMKLSKTTNTLVGLNNSSSMLVIISPMLSFFSFRMGNMAPYKLNTTHELDKEILRWAVLVVYETGFIASWYYGWVNFQQPRTTDVLEMVIIVLHPTLFAVYGYFFFGETLKVVRSLQELTIEQLSDICTLVHHVEKWFSPSRNLMIVVHVIDMIVFTICFNGTNLGFTHSQYSLGMFWDFFEMVVVLSPEMIILVKMDNMFLAHMKDKLQRNEFHQLSDLQAARMLFSVNVGGVNISLVYLLSVLGLIISFVLSVMLHQVANVS